MVGVVESTRDAIHEVEQRQSVSVILVPNIHLQTPHYDIARIRAQDLSLGQEDDASYQMMLDPKDTATSQQQQGHVMWILGQSMSGNYHKMRHYKSSL